MIQHRSQLSYKWFYSYIFSSSSFLRFTTFLPVTFSTRRLLVPKFLSASVFNISLVLVHRIFTFLHFTCFFIFVSDSYSFLFPPSLRVSTCLFSSTFCNLFLVIFICYFTSFSPFRSSQTLTSLLSSQKHFFLNTHLPRSHLKAKLCSL